MKTCILKTNLIFLFAVIVFYSSIASPIQDTSFTETAITLHTSTGDIYGTLTTPKSFHKIPVALIIAGSGPTDRNGNNPFAMNANLQKLAYALCKNNIASLRFDKRGIAESKAAVKNENDVRFDDYINDAKDWISLLKKDDRFSAVVIIGHSEGSLIGVIAATRADKFISIAGAGRPIDVVLKEQLSTQPEEVKNKAYAIIDSLKHGDTVSNIDPMFYNLFRKSVQPYLIAWFKYDPAAEIKKLTIPVLIIQGTNDIQVTTEDANDLAAADPKSKLVLIKNMNHIFRLVEGDRTANLETYSKASLPISEELVSTIVAFIQHR